MDYKYSLKPDIIYDMYGKSLIRYGINVLDFSGQIVESIPDVFLNYNKAVNFITLCNTYEIYPIHLFDLINDMFT